MPFKFYANPILKLFNKLFAVPFYYVNSISVLYVKAIFFYDFSIRLTMRYAWDKRRDPILGIAGIPGGIGRIPPGMRRQVTPPIYQKSQDPTWDRPGIPGGNGGIPPGIKDGIPSGMFHNPRRDPTNPTRDPTWDRPGIPGGIGGIPPLNFTWDMFNLQLMII